jgi:hypothetical protein
MAKAYDTGAITVTPLHDGIVGQPMAFTSKSHFFIYDDDDDDDDDDDGDL